MVRGLAQRTQLRGNCRCSLLLLTHILKESNLKKKHVLKSALSDRTTRGCKVRNSPQQCCVIRCI